jgi:hypothetical protein
MIVEPRRADRPLSRPQLPQQHPTPERARPGVACLFLDEKGKRVAALDRERYLAWSAKNPGREQIRNFDNLIETEGNRHAQ